MDWVNKNDWIWEILNSSNSFCCDYEGFYDYDDGWIPRLYEIHINRVTDLLNFCFSFLIRIWVDELLLHYPVRNVFDKIIVQCALDWNSVREPIYYFLFKQMKIKGYSIFIIKSWIKYILCKYVTNKIFLF